ncbi:hypothetical protein [Sulfurimonas sp.]|uniref:hypothetical protein n=1 Tax=Sulfurimonas sp. TaxID=2022749 RepID=UPI002AAF133B|nr:hypothetical protein [Sulfurimonas sp.]
MNKNKTILSSVLLASALTLTPFTTTLLTASTQVQINSIINSIAANLHRRGIEEDASKKIAQRFFTIDEELFSLMLQNLKNSSLELNNEKILHYISTQALMQRNVKLDSYAYLVSMTQSIKGTILNKKDLKNLNSIAQKNSFYAKGWF